MPSTPYARLRVSLDGGAVRTGRIDNANLGQVVQLSAENTSGITDYRWILRDYPPDYPCPNLWNTEADGTYFSISPVPPPFTLSLWGKYLPELRINDAALSRNAPAKFIDKGLTGIRVASPAGFRDLSFQETQEFNLRSWPDELRRDLRTAETIASNSGLSGLVLTYSANKTLSASDFAGRSLASAEVHVVCTSAMTLTFPNDASRVVGGKIRVTATFNGNAILDGNGANVQGRTHSFGATCWFQATTGRSVVYVWTGSVWAWCGIPGSVDGMVEPQAIYSPNLIAFASSDGRYTTFVAPASRSAYNGSLANAGTLTCDHAMVTNSRIARILFCVRVGDYVFDCTVIAKRDSGGTVTLVSPTTPKAVYGAGDYASPPAITLAASISSTNVRLTLTNLSGGSVVAAMGSVALSEDAS